MHNGGKGPQESWDKRGHSRCFDRIQGHLSQRGSPRDRGTDQPQYVGDRHHCSVSDRASFNCS